MRQEAIEPRPRVPNHLVWAILSTIFCCLPLGVVAIVYAAQVNGMLDAGNYRGARRASRNARIWAIAAMALAAISITLAAATWILFIAANEWQWRIF